MDDDRKEKCGRCLSTLADMLLLLERFKQLEESRVQMLKWLLSIPESKRDTGEKAMIAGLRAVEKGLIQSANGLDLVKSGLDHQVHEGEERAGPPGP